MLPWPLRIDAEDFKPTGSVEGAEFEPHGFFEFAPGELLDLDLADRVLQSARERRAPSTSSSFLRARSVRATSTSSRRCSPFTASRPWSSPS
jgi:hypothetical protein